MAKLRNVEDIYTLTPMQRLMLMHAIANPAGDVLANRVCYEIRGEVRVDPFRRAWQALIERHPALRTAFLWDGLDQPVQVVRGRVDLPFAEVDLSGLSAAERDAELDRLWDHERDRPLDPTRAPLMRCTLIRVGPDHHYFLWNIHHLVVDRWSHGILFAELAELYTGLVAGAAPALAPATGFRDYVAWLRDQDAQEAERFWRSALRGLSRPTLVAGANDSSQGQRTTQRRSLSEEETGRLRDRAAAWRVPLGSVVAAAVTLAVARRVGADDVTFGITVSGRPPDLPGVETTVGSFVNNVPQRTRLDRDALVRDWVRGIARDQTRSQRFDHVSPASIRDWSELPPDQPLFDLLVVTNLGGVESDRWPFEITPVRTTLVSAYPLTLGVAVTGEGLELVLVHDQAASAALELLAAVEDGLRTLGAADTDARVGDLAPQPRPVPGAGPAPVRPRRDATGDDLAAAILGIWREVLGDSEIGRDDDFFAVGGTSLQAAQVFARIELLLGRALPLSILVEATTVRSLGEALGAPMDGGPLIELRPGASPTAVFAVPGIGGDVVGLLPLARELGGERPFLALRSRGLDGGEPPRETIEAIAGDYADEIARTGRKRFHLLGACWGAAVAFELVRELERSGLAPLSITLLDPAVLLRNPGPTRPRPVIGFFLDRARLYGRQLIDADWPERRRVVTRALRHGTRVVRSGGIPDGVQPELRRRTVREANAHAIERYDPAALRVRARIFITGDRELGAGPDPRLEWLDLIEPRPPVTTVPGFDSGDAITTHVTHFAEAVGAWLDEVEAGAASASTREGDGWAS